MRKVYLLAVTLVTMAVSAQQKGKPFSPVAVEAEILKLDPSADYARFDALFHQLDENMPKISREQVWRAYFDMALVKYLETLKAKMPAEQIRQSSSWNWAYKTAMAAQTTQANDQTNALVELVKQLAGREVTLTNADSPGARLVSLLANPSADARAAELQKFLKDPANAEQKWAIQIAKFLLS